MAKSISFIITGGTLDSHYDGTKDTAVVNEKSVIKDFIESLNLYAKCDFTVVCMKDSRSINDADRKMLLIAIEKSKSELIIVTHGTYTLPDTARYLKANLKASNKTIVLTGSMIPLVGFSPSDAPFNLGFAFSQVQILEPGVYICFNGRTLKPEESIKNLAEGRFGSIKEK